ncbi:MAG: GNAT family N-acetyltransferase [Chloroflexota bacterium]
MPSAVTFRVATEADLPACAELWRDGINAYQSRLNQPLIPVDPSSAGRLGRLHAHTLLTDPERFVVATRRDGAGTQRVVAFGSAVVRDEVWFLSMLFVHPEEQANGLGRALLRRILPPPDAGLTLATATDSAQPISNALYASFGIVPRRPIWNFAGTPGATAGPAAMPGLPSGVRAVPFATLVESSDGQGHRLLADAVDDLDREVLGYAHPLDHRYVRTTKAHGFLFLGPDHNAIGYGYASPVGRIGPLAVRAPALLSPVLGHLLGAVEPRGSQACWVAGDADRATTDLLRAGFRIEGFPVLLCWTKPFADFARYLPTSPGLL